jgi:hypothetical protein
MTAYEYVPLWLTRPRQDGDYVPDLHIAKSATLLRETMLIERYLQPGAVAMKLCDNPLARRAYSV